MSKPLLSTDAVYQKIQQYYDANGSKINIKQLFESDPKRFDKFSLTIRTPADGDILLVRKLFLLHHNIEIFPFSTGLLKKSYHR